MSYRPEPSYRHGQPARTAVLLCNLGTPAAPTASALRTYLAELPLDALNGEPSGIRFAAALFSWGDVARDTIFAD